VGCAGKCISMDIGRYASAAAKSTSIKKQTLTRNNSKVEQEIV
jgi:hypothetical protein